MAGVDRGPWWRRQRSREGNRRYRADRLGTVLGTVQSLAELGLKPESGLVLARAGLSLEVRRVPMTSRIVGGGASGMGLVTSSCCPPTYMLDTSSMLRDEGRCATESLCAASVSRGSLAQRGRLRSSALR